MVCVDFFFFTQKTAYEMRISDWSSDVCSSDLPTGTRCHIDRRHSAGKASIAFSGHGRRLLMMATPIKRVLGATERIVEMHGATAGQPDTMAPALLGHAAGRIIRQPHPTIVRKGAA